MTQMLKMSDKLQFVVGFRELLQSAKIGISPTIREGPLIWSPGPSLTVGLLTREFYQPLFGRLLALRDE